MIDTNLILFFILCVGFVVIFSITLLRTHIKSNREWKRQEEATENLPKQNTIEIIERIDEDENLYYTAQVFRGPYHESWKYLCLITCVSDETISPITGWSSYADGTDFSADDGHTYRIHTCKFESIDEAQEQANETELQYQREKKARTYRKTVGSFRVGENE